MIAIIDIGSNSVRMMIDADGMREKYVNTTRLGEGLNASGILSNIARERTLHAVRDYVEQARALSVNAIYAYATEAVRAASNGNEFCDAIYAATGIKVRILNGDEEAACSFYGAMSGAESYGKSLAYNKLIMYGIVDIGGASTELTVGNANGIKYSHSAPYGIVRVKDYAGEDTDKIAQFLKNADSEYGKAPIFDALIGIGGTLTSLAAIKHGLKIYDRNAVHGTVLTALDLANTMRMLSSMSIKERKNVAGLSPARIDTIIGGICIAEKIMNITNKREIVVSESDNLEGFMMLSRQGKI